MMFVSEISLLAQSVLPSAVAGGLGVFLKSTVCNETDAITIWRIASYITFPCLVLRTFLGPVPLPVSSIAAITGVYTASVIIPAIMTWASTKYMHPKERGVLAGMSLGSSVDLFALPVVVAAASSFRTFYGGAADVMLYTGCLVALLNVVTTHLLAPLYFSTAGPAFPKNFKHTDGGIYNGEWKGALKDGFGVYTYPSGAAYEGEWLDGTKEGRGVYRFAKGGIYEGEWRNGKMEGVGVRTYSSGKVVSGLWEQGRLAKAIDESQCALVVANANEAALCAKKVFVGGIDAGDIIRGLLTQPGLVIGVAALVLSCGVGIGVLTPPRLPPGLDVVTSELARAHGVLSLVGFGMSIDQTPVERRQMSTVTQTVARRVCPGLVLCAVAAIATPTMLPMASICVLALAIVSPMSPRTLELTHIFRLNENLVAAACRFSNRVAVACTLAVLYAAQRASYLASAGELSYGLCLAAIGLLVLVSYWNNSAQKARGGKGDFYSRTIKMVYRGNAPGDSNSTVEEGGSDGGISGTATAACRPMPTSTTPMGVPTSLAPRPCRPARLRLAQNVNLLPRLSRPFSRPVARAW